MLILVLSSYLTFSYHMWNNVKLLCVSITLLSVSVNPLCVGVNPLCVIVDRCVSV